MAALTAARDTKQKGDLALPVDFVVKMKASTTIHQGSLVVLDGTTGLAEPATAAASKRVLGVAQESVTSAASGDYFVKVKRGTFKFGNKAGDLVTVASVDADCSIEDDQTVRATAAGTSAAGRVYAVESDGVWVTTFSTGS